jgi:hypothetical protein
MRACAAGERAIAGLTIEQKVVAETALAGDEALVLRAANRLADEAEVGLVVHCHSMRQGRRSRSL